MAFLLLGLTLLSVPVLHPLAGVPSRAFLVAKFANSAIAALAGGYATAVLAPNRPVVHTAALAVMILSMGLSTIGHPQPGEPGWYSAALAVAGCTFALCGGRLRRTRPMTQVRGAAT